jgi:hypothetical protein
MADQSQGSSPLPIELLQMIFENLSIADQVRASRASKFWFNVLLGLTGVIINLSMSRILVVLII